MEIHKQELRKEIEFDLSSSICLIAILLNIKPFSIYRSRFNSITLFAVTMMRQNTFLSQRLIEFSESELEKIASSINRPHNQRWIPKWMEENWLTTFKQISKRNKLQFSTDPLNLISSHPKMNIRLIFPTQNLHSMTSRRTSGMEIGGRKDNEQSTYLDEKRVNKILN